MALEISELQKLATAEVTAAQALQTKWKGRESEMSKEDDDKIAAHLGKFDEYKARIELAQRMHAADEFLNAPAGTKAAQFRPASPGEGALPVDPLAWREVEYDAWAVNTLGMVVPIKKKYRFHTPLTQKGKDFPKEYHSAFNAYLQKGERNLGPNDYKTLSEGVDSAGGFTTPEDYHVELIKKMMTMATVRANARVVTTSRDIAKWPRINYTTDDLYTSGVRLTWTGETPASATTHRVTDPVFGLYTIPVHTAMASMPITNDLLEDSAFDIASISSDLMAEAFTLGENDAFWNGNGLARPQGILSQVGGNGPASVISQETSTLTPAGLIALAYALPSQYERNAKFYFRKATEQTIRGLRSDSGAGAGTGDFLWPIIPQVGNFGANPRELLGYPTVRDEFVPAIAASAYPIAFGDLSGYLVLDRVGFSVQRLTEVYAETNITLLLARKRVGGQLVEPWRVKAQVISTV